MSDKGEVTITNCVAYENKPKIIDLIDNFHYDVSAMDYAYHTGDIKFMDERRKAVLQSRSALLFHVDALQAEITRLRAQIEAMKAENDEAHAFLNPVCNDWAAEYYKDDDGDLRP